MLPIKTRQANDLRDAFSLKLAAFAPGDGGEDDEETDEEGEGSSGTGTDDQDDDEGTSGADGKSKEVKNPERQKASREAARYRTEAKAAKQERDALAARLREIEDKDKSELEKLQRDHTEIKADRDRLAKIVEDQSLRLAFFTSGAAKLLNKPDQAVKLMDLSEFKPDENGNVDAKALLAYVEGWLKEGNAHFAATAASDDDSDDEPKPNSGRLTGKPKSKDTEKVRLVEKFPALANR